MIENSKIVKAFAYIIVILLIFNIFCQILGFKSNSFVTEFAEYVSVNDCISTEGIFVRDEQVVYGQNKGAIVLKLKSGEKASKDEEIAVYYDSAKDAEISSQIELLDAQIQDYTYVISQANEKNDTVKLDKEIVQLIYNISDSVSGGTFCDTSDLISDIKSKVVRRSLMYRDITPIVSKLDALKLNQKTLQAKLSGHTTSVYADFAGYFSKDVDGYETVFSSQNIDEITNEVFDNLSGYAVPVSNNAVGKLSTSFEWYFVCRMSGENAQRLINRFGSVKKLKVSFEHVSQNAAMSLDRFTEQPDGSYIVVLKGTDVTEELLRARHSNADIILNTYEGIQIPTKALRQLDGEWGDYCLSGQRLIFKPVNIVYETDSYFISAADGLSSKEVFIYDEIVISGKGLTDKQVIQ